MKTVQPIRDKKIIEKIKKILHKNNTRDYVLFVVGINSGLRISDLLSLKIADVTDNNGKLKDRISIIEQKTGKAKDFPISKTASDALKELLSDRNIEDDRDSFLFPSRQGNDSLSRVQAWRVINTAAKESGINTEVEPIGTHTMRKTFGYWAYKKGMDLSLIQKLLNHSSPAITLSYIGITRDDLDDVYLNLNL